MNDMCNVSFRLQYSKAKYGKTPKKLYIQIDGGCENTAKAVLLVCEYLISKGVFEEITISRLPVGHTHEVENDFLHTIDYQISKVR
jgi:hypothetical protein